MHHCDTTPSFKSIQERLEYLYSSEWLSVFGNYTLTFVTAKWSCSNAKLVRSVENYLTSIQFGSQIVLEEHLKSAFPTSIKAKFNRLQFVACSYPIKSALPFNELTNIYQTEVWMLCVVTLLVLSLLPNYLRRNCVFSLSSFVKKLDIHLKIYLGQDISYGDQFTSNLFMCLSCLASIILSNAYKYDNVYRMIAPRDVLPYTKFQQLEDNHFEILTKTHHVWIYPTFLISTCDDNIAQFFREDQLVI